MSRLSTQDIIDGNYRQCFDPDGEIELWSQEAAARFGPDSEATKCVQLIAR
jgi:hypothetical protein